MKRGKYRIPSLKLRMIRERSIAVERDRILSPADAAAVARALIGDLPNEHVIAMMIDGRGNLTSVTTIAIGSMHGAAVTASSVLRAVLASHASAFILAHNHPSGDATPSAEDREITEKIARAATLVGVPLLDHVIVTRTLDFARVPIEGA